MKSRMGLCWSEPPVAQPVASPQKPSPSAPAYVPPAPYTYAVPYEPQKMYVSQQYPPQQYPPHPYPPQQYPMQQHYPQQQYYPPQQQQQIGTGTAIAGGLLLGMVMEDMFDSMD